MATGKSLDEMKQEIAQAEKATDNMLEVIYFGPRLWRLDDDKITLFYVKECGDRVEIELSKPKTEHRILVSPSAIDYYIKALKIIKPFTIGH